MAQNETIGFIGLGIMGKPMAKHVRNAGYPLIVHNRSQAAVDELAALGAQRAATPREVAERADIVITMLPDSPQVEEVIGGSGGIAEGIRPGAVVIDMSSINPLTTKKMGELLAARGARMLDAPVSGGEIGAIEAKLAIMVGGNTEVFERVRPLLQTMGTTITLVGELGSGNVVKLMNQMMVATHIAALSEAMAFGRKAGIDPLLAYEAVRGGLAGSRVLETKINNVASGVFKPGFRVELHEKDLRNAMSVGGELGADLTFTSQLYNMLIALREQGYGQEDHSALYRMFEAVQTRKEGAMKA